MNAELEKRLKEFDPNKLGADIDWSLYMDQEKFDNKLYYDKNLYNYVKCIDKKVDKTFGDMIQARYYKGVRIESKNITEFLNKYNLKGKSGYYAFFELLKYHSFEDIFKVIDKIVEKVNKEYELNKKNDEEVYYIKIGKTKFNKIPLENLKDTTDTHKSTAKKYLKPFILENWGVYEEDMDLKSLCKLYGCNYNTMATLILYKDMSYKDALINAKNYVAPKKDKGDDEPVLFKTLDDVIEYKNKEHTPEVKKVEPEVKPEELFDESKTVEKVVSKKESEATNTVEVSKTDDPFISGYLKMKEEIIRLKEENRSLKLDNVKLGEKIRQLSSKDNNDKELKQQIAELQEFKRIFNLYRNTLDDLELYNSGSKKISKELDVLFDTIKKFDLTKTFKD